eukprot:CAMPEP_0201507170 /NCGR_PEP_ID=MMETSP0161_2-20130828/916_1 /ASSEMBLY_ACC=CAM_ASM_000251 /TAXON_ID=180227 /ORGANISM="Neoparamoeba aestuarina, Strain SoJaBio B1-5/56/2" /LENGTH=375 /DNA_ID=CAMNT_0047901463 /DNA_START=310 /DNA_END=1434 /DNA_ORIENTATION=-
MDVPLLGPESQIGEYYMKFTLGSPAAPFTAQVDTGSSDLSIPGANCNKCGNDGDLPYSPNNSSTSVTVSCSHPPDGIYCPKCSHSQCEYDISYADGSGFTSVVYEDLYGMGDYKPYKTAFGTMITESHNFEPKGVDGIIGFAFSALSEIEAATPVDNLYSSGQISKNLFSICITENGGVVSFGSDGSYYNGSIQYTPIVSDHGHNYWYEVTIEDMLVNGESLGVSSSTYNRGGAIVDSGTTDFCIPDAAYQSLYDNLHDNCNHVNLVGVCGVSYSKSIFNGYCYKMTQAEVQAYPSIEIKMDNNVKIFVPSQYWVTSDYCRSGEYALALESLGFGEGTIMGDAVMKNMKPSMTEPTTICVLDLLKCTTAPAIHKT